MRRCDLTPSADYCVSVSDPFSLLSRSELSRRRARLLARIRRKYQIVEESLLIGPLRIPFTRVANPDVVLDQVCEAEDDLHLPYWAELWDSAIGVGHFLARVQGSGFRVQNVLDLGCGMGLAGTVAAALGHDVLLADIETAALLFAKINTLPYASRVRIRQLNWQTDRLDERFDLIIGADVLYERAQWEHLEPFWRAHLHENGSILLAEPGRMTGDLFGDWIAERGWTIELHEQRIPSRPRPIRLLQLTR